ncbi:hypothetical protein VTI28DRAFT_9006 [Corynascus sepedonium]
MDEKDPRKDARAKDGEITRETDSSGQGNRDPIPSGLDLHRCTTLIDDDCELRQRSNSPGNLERSGVHLSL